MVTHFLSELRPRMSVLRATTAFIHIVPRLYSNTICRKQRHREKGGNWPKSKRVSRGGLNPGLSGARLVVFLHTQPCCVPDLRAGGSSGPWPPLGTEALAPPRSHLPPPLHQEPRDPGSPACIPPSTGPRTHLFSWQTEPGRPGLPFSPRGPGKATTWLSSSSLIPGSGLLHGSQGSPADTDTG